MGRASQQRNTETCFSDGSLHWKNREILSRDFLVPVQLGSWGRIAMSGLYNVWCYCYRSLLAPKSLHHISLCWHYMPWASNIIGILVPSWNKIKILQSFFAIVLNSFHCLHYSDFFSYLKTVSSAKIYNIDNKSQPQLKMRFCSRRFIWSKK